MPTDPFKTSAFLHPAPPEPFPANWEELSPDAKYAFYKGLMLNIEGQAFDSEQVAQTFLQSTKRLLDIVDLKQPDRVPAIFSGPGVVAKYGGITQAEVFYEGDKEAAAIQKFHEDFDPEYGVSGLSLSGRALDLIGVNIMRWPGSPLPNGLQANNFFQYVETENMLAEEYDALIKNPEGFMMRTFYPRIFEGLKGLSNLFNLFSCIEPAVGAGLLTNIGKGPVREALERLFAAADLQEAHSLPADLVRARMCARFGTPSLEGGFSLAPFDIIADTMRGTRGVMLDMYRCPDKLLAACEAITPSAIHMATQTPMLAHNPFVSIPLHKGADNFMSKEQFKKFYWPSFKALLLGIIEAGLIPTPFVEGAYNQRLDIIAEAGLPRGRTAWWFDQTDMAAAKKKFGPWACIGGNVPASLFVTATPGEMDAACRKVIETCAPGGGFFLAPGAIIDQGRPENIHAFLESTKKYGVY
jgi:uroporphyrinogen-III decarboxylase